MLIVSDLTRSLRRKNRVFSDQTAVHQFAPFCCVHRSTKPRRECGAKFRDLCDRCESVVFAMTKSE